jgi:hypothetical protein
VKRGLPILVALGSLVLANGLGAAAVSPRDQYEQSLARVARSDRFELKETVRVVAGQRRTARTLVQFIGPDRLRQVITTVAPPPKVQLVTVQVGKVRCQTPPKTCFRYAQPAPLRTIRSLLEPKLRLTYRLAEDPPPGLVVVKLTAVVQSSGARFDGRLSIDAKHGRPVTYAATVSKGGRMYVTQHATFNYDRHFTIRLPRGVRRPR